MIKLLDNINRNYPCIQNEDRRVWTLEDNGSFTVKSCYKHLLPRNKTSYPWKDLWWCKVPSKVVFFAWTALEGRILTMDNLQRWGIPLPDMC